LPEKLPKDKHCYHQEDYQKKNNAVAGKLPEDKHCYHQEDYQKINNSIAGKITRR